MRHKQLSFLEANRIINQSLTKDLPKKNLRLLSSCQLSQLNIYIKALYANSGYNLDIEELNFGTLRQYLIDNLLHFNDKETILILMPWDFIESLNWRTGIPLEIENIEVYQNEISAFYNLCNELKIDNLKYIYLDFEFPNFLPKYNENKIIKRQLEDVVEKLSCKVLNNDFFAFLITHPMVVLSKIKKWER